MEAEKKTILIADDVEINRTALRKIFEDQFLILEAADGQEAIDHLDADHDRIVILFLDLVMPRKDGLEVMKYMNEKGYMDTIPVIMITGEATVDTDVKAYEYGAMDIIYKPFDLAVIMRRTLNILELFENRFNMEKKLEERTKKLVESQKKLEKNNEFLINALSSVVEFRSLESGEHVRRVRYFTQILLNVLNQHYPEYGLNQEKIDAIVKASALHDIGKIAISDNILLKPGRLTKEEFEEMKKHTTLGCEILEKFKMEESDFYQECYDICRYHHERYDGGGYPDGLTGEESPIWAQVVSIVDVYDALVSKRVYKAAYAVEEAEKMIRNGECGVFSPKLLKCFDIAREELHASLKYLSYADHEEKDQQEV